MTRTFRLTLAILALVFAILSMVGTPFVLPWLALAVIALAVIHLA